MSKSKPLSITAFPRLFELLEDEENCMLGGSIALALHRQLPDPFAECHDIDIICTHRYTAEYMVKKIVGDVIPQTPNSLYSDAYWSLTDCTGVRVCIFVNQEARIGTWYHGIALQDSLQIRKWATAFDKNRGSGTDE